MSLDAANYVESESCASGRTSGPGGRIDPLARSHSGKSFRKVDRPIGRRPDRPRAGEADCGEDARDICPYYIERNAPMVLAALRPWIRQPIGSISLFETRGTLPSQARARLRDTYMPSCHADKGAGLRPVLFCARSGCRLIFRSVSGPKSAVRRVCCVNRSELRSPPVTEWRRIRCDECRRSSQRFASFVILRTGK